MVEMMTGRTAHNHKVHKAPVGIRNRARAIRRAVAGLVFAAACVGFAVLGTAVVSGRWQVRPVLSGSMRPGLPIGGVVVTQRVPIGDLKLRDVAVFHPPGSPQVDYVHRVISLRHVGSTVVVNTQGDANAYPDPWTLRIHGPWVYVARFTVPLVGYPAVWVHSPGGRRDLVVAAGAIALALVGSVAVEMTAKRKKKPAAEAPDSSHLEDGADATAGVERNAAGETLTVPEGHVGDNFVIDHGQSMPTADRDGVATGASN